MSKSVYYQTANPKAVKVPRFNKKLVFKFRFKSKRELFFEVDGVIAGDVIVFFFFFEKMSQ